MSRESTMVLHCGGKTASLEEVTAVQTPEPEGMWHPIAHRALYDQVKLALENMHMRIVDEKHALAKEGLRYFGLLQVANGQSAGADYSYMIGLRNSSDKSIVAGLAVGSRVFVCGNLSFTAEIVIARKHTRHIMRDLPVLTGRAVGQLSTKWTDMDNRFKAYKAHDLADSRVNDLVIRSLDMGAITCQQIPRVLSEWRHPSINEFAVAPKNVWRFFNAVTGVAKDTSIFTLPKRTQALHALLDSECGIVTKDTPQAITEGTEDAEVAVNN